MRVLVGCEFSQIVTFAFRAAGHRAYSCDLLPTEGNPEYHIQGDVLDILDQNWDLGIFHPSCTYISNSGVRHLSSVPSKNGVLPKIHGEERWQKLREACEFFNKLKNAPIPKIAIENPIPHKYAKEMIGQYDQILYPWQHGEKIQKPICLWLKNLPKLQPTNVVGPPPKIMTPEEKRSWYRIHYASPGPDRWKERSRFFAGIAKSMSEQWG